MLKGKPISKDLKSSNYDAYLVFHHQHITGIAYAYRNKEGNWVKEVGYSDLRRGLAMIDGFMSLMTDIKTKGEEKNNIYVSCSDIYIMKLWAGYLKEQVAETKKISEWKDHFEFISFPKPNASDALFQELKNSAKEIVN